MLEGNNGEEEKYAFNACYPDPSCLRNRLAFGAYRDMGVPAPEIVPAALFLNGEYLGYYDKTEIYNGEKLKTFYGADDLELYKCHFCEYENNNAYGEEHPLQSLTEKKYPDDGDYESLNSMIITYLELDDDEWNLWVADNFDVDATARYCAVHKMLQVGETSFFNYYIAVADGKYTLLPWDNENCLYDDADSTSRGMGRLHARLLIDGSPVKTLYLEYMKDFVDGDNTVIEDMLDRVSSYSAEIDRAVFFDSYGPYDYDAFLAQKTYLTNHINGRISQIETDF